MIRIEGISTVAIRMTRSKRVNKTEKRSRAVRRPAAPMQFVPVPEVVQNFD